MKEVIISDSKLKQAAEQGMDAFVNVIVDSIYDSIGGELTAETMDELNSQQITLLAYRILRDEVMDGGFVQLIHNGYGSFIFENPFAKAIKQWGIKDLSRLIYNVYPLYKKYGEKIASDCTDEEFMALFEQFPEFDDADDEFVEKEEQWTSMVAVYLDEHLADFGKIG